jgi:hypothetical protein
MNDARQVQEKRDWTELSQLAEKHGLSDRGSWRGDYVGPLWLRRLVGPLPVFEAQRHFGFSKRTSPLTGADIDPLLPTLAKLRYLDSISIGSDSEADESAYRSIANMPQITRLDINADEKKSISISAQELRHLAEMKNLKQLEFYFVAEIRDTAILARLTNLQQLTIITHVIDDPQLSFLAGMKNLRRLELTSVPCDDRAVENIARLQNLEWIDIAFSSMSAEGLDRLRAALPHCNTEMLALRRKAAARQSASSPVPATKP